MKKSRWIFIIVLVFIIITALLFSLYSKIMEPEKQLSKEAIKRASQIVELVNVNDVEHFFGREAYHVIDAETAEGHLYIFVPHNEELQIITAKKDNGITEQQAKEIILQSKSEIEILTIRLAIDKKLPLWEIVYKEKNGQRTFIYLTYKTGEFYKRLTISN
jgi:uncharacterized protein YpmB